MASFSIHLAIGKRYIEKYRTVKNEKEFYQGIIAPDLAKDKKISHYTGNANNLDLIQYLPQKVLLYEYLKSENIDSDYQKGVFLHLLTDYLFFNKYFDYNFLSNISYSDFCKDLYYSYDVVNNYIDQTYQLNYNELLDEINNAIIKTKINKKTSNETRTNILSLKLLDEFIDYVSSINLDNYKEKILSYKKNVFPDNL